MALLWVLIVCCKQEHSLEIPFPRDGNDTIINPPDTTDPVDTTDPPNLDTPATFTLITAPNGGCANVLVQGNYVSGGLLDETHTITLEVDVTSPGQWEISSEIVNGMFFANAGIFTDKGPQTVVLMGVGVPGESGNTILPVTVNNTTCGFAVSVSED